jgi:hypothetical protein
MKPFVVDRNQLHFKLARLGGVKIKEDKVSIYDATAGTFSIAKTYELNIKDFCSYWRRVALGSLFAFLITGAVALYLTPILIFLSCAIVPHFHEVPMLTQLHDSAVYMIGGGMLGVSLVFAAIMFLITKAATWIKQYKKWHQARVERLKAEGKLPEKPAKAKKEKPSKPKKQPRESIIAKAYRTHKEKYCVPVKLDVDGTFSE